MFSMSIIDYSRGIIVDFGSIIGDSRVMLQLVLYMLSRSIIDDSRVMLVL
jgi:hypothetical protein